MAEARKTVTIVFADVAGSTALGERLDPEAVRALAEVLDLAGKPAEAAEALHEAVALARRREGVILVDRAEARLAELRASR
jgi:hypothetical protein